MEMMGQGQMSWLCKGDWCSNLKLALSLLPKLPKLLLPSASEWISQRA